MDESLKNLKLFEKQKIFGKDLELLNGKRDLYFLN